MLRKIISVVISIVYPKTPLIEFVQTSNTVEFEHKLRSQPQMHARMFYPFYYKDSFVRDCIIELKERNNLYVAKRFGKIIAWRIKLYIDEIEKYNRDKIELQYYLVPTPQHISKTIEKGFCHTTTLTRYIYSNLISKCNIKNIKIYPCIIKEKNIRKLHNTKRKNKRFGLIKNSMKAYVTKHDAQHTFFFIIDDVYTTGATYKEINRSLLECNVASEHIFFISIAH